MGIRIHKMCGWALTDLVPGDERVNWDSPLFRYQLGGQEHVEAYLKALETADPMAGILDRAILTGGDPDRRTKLHMTVQASFEWGTEDGGDPSVLCVRPVSCTDWYRFDDIIDWLEAEDMEPRVRPLNRGIYPYEGILMDTRTGERLGREALNWKRVWESVRWQELDLGPEEGALAALNVLAGQFGMTHEEAVKHTAPRVPDEVRVLCEYAQVFRDPRAWLGLRPVVYTFWR